MTVKQVNHMRPPGSAWRKGFLAVVGGLTGGFFLVISILFTALVLFYRSDVILPGVETLGVGLGGLSTAEAAQVLEQNWQRRAITLHNEQVNQSLSPAELGILLDVPATVARAHQYGRSSGQWQDLWQLNRRVTIDPVWRVESTLTEQSLQNLGAAFTVAPTNAALQIVNQQVQIDPAEAGHTLDVPATQATLIQNLPTVVAQAHLPVTLKPLTPTLTAADLQGVALGANQFLSQTITLRGFDPIVNQVTYWPLAPETWTNWVALSFDAAVPAGYRWTLDEGALESYLKETISAQEPTNYIKWAEAVAGIKTALNTDPAPNKEVRVRIFHSAQQHIVRAGETISSIARDYGLPYPWVLEVNPNLGDALYAGDVVTIPSPDALLPLPVLEHKRIVISLSEQRMWAYEYGALKWEWPVSTGIPSSPTSPGVFQVQSHEVNAYASNWDLWMPHFIGIYRPVPSSSFMNGFHGFPTRDGYNLLWVNDLGRPATYGCILVSSENAISLFDWAEAGVIVEVVL